MIRFSTSDTVNFPDTACLLTRDGQVVRGSVTVQDDIIEASAPGHPNIGIRLLCDAGSAGRLVLRTALLPPREEPYLLTLELARFRIKMFLDKSEEWQMFDLSNEHPALEAWEEARQLFTRAIVCTDLTEMDRLSREALEKAIDATERLAMAHAQILLHRRFGKRAASSSTLGVRISPSRYDKPLRDVVEKNVDLIAVPMHWASIETTEGEYDWADVDRWIAWARDHDKPIIAGPVLDFSADGAIPPWVSKWEHDFPAFRDRCYDHMERVIRRYGPTVAFWNIAAGINTNRHVALSAGGMVDLIRTAALLARQASRGARVMIELTEPYAEYVASQSDSLGPLVFLDRLVQEGIRLDAIGVRLLVGNGTGMATRDLMELSAMLDQFFLVEKPLLVSAMGAPSRTLGEESGWWRHEWNEAQQEQWAGQMLGIALSKPYVDSVIWTDLFDHEHAELPSSGLVSRDGKPRPAMGKLFGMRKRLRKPLGPLQLPKKSTEEA